MSNLESNQPLISVVVPVYCEGRHLSDVITAICEALGTLNAPCELILVDDGSPDDSWEVITEESRTRPALRALRLSRNFGKEAALCAGLDMARGKAVIVMDGDLQHPPALIPEMVRTWRESGADVVEAVKTHPGKQSILVKCGSRLFYSLLKKLSGFDLEGASDFKLMDRRAVDAWRRMKERNVFFRGMSAWLGYQRVQLPFVVPERVGGQSRWSTLRLVRLAVTGLTSFSSLPLLLVNFLGGICLLVAVVLGSQALFLKATGRAVTGFTTVITLQLLIASFLMISLGIIGEYIARIYDEVKGRPRYVVRDAVHKATGQDGQAPTAKREQPTDEHDNVE